VDTDRHHHRAHNEKSDAGDSEAGERGAEVIADPESQGDARQDEAQAGQDPTTHDHRNVAHQQTKALFDFQTQEGELLVEEPHRLAQKVLDKP